MFVQCLSVPLLKQYPMEAGSQALRQRQVGQPDLGRLNRKKVCELAPRLKNDQLAGAALRRGRTKLGLIDESTQLLRDGNMPQFRLVGSSLHSDGQEFSVVTFQVALQECDHVTCCAHSFIRGRRTGPAPFGRFLHHIGADRKKMPIRILRLSSS